MKCSIHRIKEYIDVDISVIAMDEETATEFCKKTAKLIGKHVSDTWKIEITNQTPAENLQERYYCTITYEIESKKIDKEIDGTTPEDMERTKESAELLTTYNFGKGIEATFGGKEAP